MRTLNDIKKIITDTYVSEMATAGYTVDPTTWSAVNLIRIIIFAFAFCQFVQEQIFGTHVTEVNDTIANKTPHRIKWYENTVKAFRYGYTVNPDTFKYDDTGLTEAVITASQIVAYCAVTEESDSLNVKVAKDNGTDLEPLATIELDALRDYMENQTYGQKDAGVFLTFINELADSLKLGLDIYYKPTILDSNGVEISSGKETVKNAIKLYLKSLQFNGVFDMQSLIDVLQKVPGVVFVKTNSVQVKADGAIDYATVDVYYLPNSGYLRFLDDSDLSLEFTPYAG